MKNSKENKESWLFVTPWTLNSIGGVSRVISEISKSMKNSNDYDPIILITDWNHKKPKTNKQTDNLEIKMRIRSPSDTGIKSTISFLLNLPITLIRLTKIVKENNIQVINIHYPGLLSINFIILNIFNPRIKIILSFHGSDIKRIKNESNTRIKIWNLILKMSDHVVSCSEGLSKEVSTFFPKHINKCSHIHNGTTIKNKKESQIYTLPKEYLLSVGTFEEKKGHDVTIKSFKMISEKYDALKLVIVGRHTEYIKHCIKIIKNTGLEDKVLLFTDIDHKNIHQFFEGAKIFISSSRYEPFGLVITEAGHHKVPVIATRTAGATEILDHLNDGIIVEINDIESTANALKSLLESELKCKEYGEKLKLKVDKKFTWKTTEKNYVNLIKNN